VQLAVKYFEVADIGIVRIAKRSDARSLRLSITASGEIRVTIPSWSPYKHGVDFARSKSVWILNNLPGKEPPLVSGFRIGKAHRLDFMTAAIDSPTSRLSGNEIRVSRPLGMAITHPAVQKVAQRASIRALRSQAEALLPHRLKTLAAQYGFSYQSVNVKLLKGRWGSCDSYQNIVLNLFLMQLPWELIDYVLTHELIHTKYLNHGVDFWDEFLRHEPDAKILRRRIKLCKPVLQPAAP
jgi:predicted metal-dependent hydrolase